VEGVGDLLLPEHELGAERDGARAIAEGEREDAAGDAELRGEQVGDGGGVVLGPGGRERDVG
jgi:hypothetical protein